MNKYTELSDFEINKKVAARYYQNKDFIEAYKDVEKVFVDGNLYDPCKNPSDAMPIIIENKICLTVGDSDDIWVADTTRSLESSFNENPLRAAMEVFLMIKDAENEKV